MDDKRLDSLGVAWYYRIMKQISTRVPERLLREYKKKLIDRGISMRQDLLEHMEAISRGTTRPVSCEAEEEPAKAG